MIIDRKKEARQIEGFTKWLNHIAIAIVKAGIFIYPTGFGKTYVAIMAIKAMNGKHPDRDTIVIVPTTKLKQDWDGYNQVDKETGKKEWVKGHIDKHDLKNVRVFVVNTYVQYQQWKCDLLVLDEVHHYLSIESKFFSTVIGITTFRFAMGFSATLNKTQIEIAESLGWKIVDEISHTEAEVEGFVSNSITYNLGIELSEEDKAFNDQVSSDFKYYFNKFDSEFEMLRACNIRDSATLPVKLREGFIGVKTGKEWRLWWARRKNWDGTENHPFSPKNLSKYAAQGMFAMMKRRQVLQNMPSKFHFIKKIVDKYPNLKTIIFSESSDFADKVTELFPGTCLSYHSNLVSLGIKDDVIVKNPSKEDKILLKKQGYKIKGATTLRKEAIQEFQNPNSKITKLSAVRALDEGFDVQAIEVVVKAAYNSTPRQGTQRDGRGTRIDYDNLSKRTLIVNLYMKNSQEEKWLRTQQAGKRSVRWIDSVEEISINHKISLGGAKPDTIPPTETGVIEPTVQV